MTSGGVKIAPTMNAPTMTYGRIDLSFSSETTPIRTSTTTTIGVSKVSPKAMNIVSTNDRYLSMSVIICTPTGVYFAKKPNAIGNTKKYANAIPQAKKNTLETSTGSTRRFSC